jgi:hypothetical protein
MKVMSGSGDGSLASNVAAVDPTLTTVLQPYSVIAISNVMVSNSTSTATSSVTYTLDDAIRAPTIRIQPVRQTATPGQMATFTVTTNERPLICHWQKEGMNIAGKIGPSFITSAASTEANATIADVAVSNSGEKVVNNPAILTAETSSRTYTTRFPLAENPVSEQGNWINGGKVGLDWGNVQVTPGRAFGTVVSGGPPYNDSTAIVAGSWSSDQMACATIYTVNQNSKIFEEVELRLRTTITAHSITGYELVGRVTSDGTQYIEIVRWEGPLNDFTSLRSVIGPGLRNGDVMCATAIGSTLTLYVNDVQIVQVADTAYAEGSPGMGFYNQGGTLANNSDYGFADFFASNVTATIHIPNQ